MIQYERITSASTDDIVKLYQAGNWWEESPEARAAIPKMLQGSFCVVAARDINNGKLIAMGRALSDGHSDAYIQDVVVLNQFRGQGIGSQIILHLAAFCQQKGISWIGLIGEPGTQSFYEKLGFSPMTDYIPLKLNKSLLPKDTLKD